MIAQIRVNKQTAASSLKSYSIFASFWWFESVAWSLPPLYRKFHLKNFAILLAFLLMLVFEWQMESEGDNLTFTFNKTFFSVSSPKGKWRCLSRARVLFPPVRRGLLLSIPIFETKFDSILQSMEDPQIINWCICSEHIAVFHRKTLMCIPHWHALPWKYTNDLGTVDWFCLQLPHFFSAKESDNLRVSLQNILISMFWRN